jgi:exonuclease III
MTLLADPSLDIDSTAQGFWNKMSSLTEEERTGMSDILHPQDSEESVLVDVWRRLHPADEAHTCANSLHRPNFTQQPFQLEVRRMEVKFFHRSGGSI